LLVAASCLGFTAACAVNAVTGQHELSFIANTWNTAETVAANALPVDIRLTSGQLLKVVVERPYMRPEGLAPPPIRCLS
jgi:hypothetical protein